MAFAWNKFNIQHLREMWAKGVTASQIATALGNPSRNSVIGKASRLGLMGRDSPIIRGGSGPRKAYDRSAHKRSPTVPRQDPDVAQAQKRSEAREHELAERARLAQQQAEAQREADRKRHDRILARAAASERHRCAFPIGDPKLPDFRFYGATIEPGTPYCAEHRARCWAGKVSEPSQPDGSVALPGIMPWSPAARRVG